MEERRSPKPQVVSSTLTVDAISHILPFILPIWQDSPEREHDDTPIMLTTLGECIVQNHFTVDGWPSLVHGARLESVKRRKAHASSNPAPSAIS